VASGHPSQPARRRLLAGLTGALIVLPQGVAFATIAGLPPQYGLYAAMVPAVIGALFGSSWHLVSGPTTAISIAVFAALSHQAEPGTAQYINLVLTLTFLVGVFQLVLGLARMGALVNFISHTVVIGFTAGAAILIAASQVRSFFGIDIPRGTPFYEIIRQLSSSSRHQSLGHGRSAWRRWPPASWPRATSRSFPT
jgi:SulP family sulfate permease